MDAYPRFLGFRFVHRSGNEGTILLANPTQVSHWFANLDVWKKLEPVVSKSTVGNW